MTVSFRGLTKNLCYGTLGNVRVVDSRNITMAAQLLSERSATIQDVVCCCITEKLS